MELTTRDGALSLYFQLKDGEKADLEVVAKAAIEWVAALRTAAQSIDPTANIKVEIIDAKEGSISINTVLEWVENRIQDYQEGKGKYPRLRKLALALAIFVPLTGYPTYDFYFGDNAEINLTEDDKKIVLELIQAIHSSPAITEKKQAFFRSLEQDASISGVGITEASAKPPLMIIPSSEFAERSGVWQSMIPDEQSKRTLYPELEVTLISPVLLPKARSWRFQPLGLPEFSAKMEDKKFLAALENDHIRERLRTGITMEIRLKVEEIKIDGVWEIKSRSVIEVISPKID